MFEALGTIVRLQVQATPVKASGRYDSIPILTGPSASISDAGMLLRNDTGWIIDAHHRDYPRARGGGNRPLSIGFTGHYAAMADRFGNAPIGIAGENIIVEGPAVWMSDIGGGVMIRRPDGKEISLTSPRPAAPCRPFTSFMVGSSDVLPREEIADELDFLSAGRRGFLVELDRAEGHQLIEVGDEIFIRHP